jgi:hypothetical protein
MAVGADSLPSFETAPKKRPLTMSFLCRNAAPSIRYRHVESIQRHRDHAIQANEVGQLGRAVLAELVDRRAIGQFRQHAAVDQRGSEIIGDRFLSRQIRRPLAGDDRCQLLIRQTAMFGDDDMAYSSYAERKCAPVTRMATSRTVAGSDGCDTIALVSSQTGLPNFGSRIQGFHGPSRAPSPVY